MYKVKILDRTNVCCWCCRTMSMPQYPDSPIPVSQGHWLQQLSRRVQRETLSPGPRHCYGYQNGTCIRQHFHGSSRGTVIEVSGPETIFMAKVHWRYWHEVVARPRDFDSFPRRSQQLPPEHKVYGWNFNQAARVSGHQIKSCDLYTKPTDTHQYLLPTSCHPKHFCKNVPYSLALRLRRICSDRTPLHQEQENWLTTSANGVIRNRKFHLPLREHGNKREKTYFLIGLNPSRTFSPSCWYITQTCQKWGI